MVWPRARRHGSSPSDAAVRATPTTADVGPSAAAAPLCVQDSPPSTESTYCNKGHGCILKGQEGQEEEEEDDEDDDDDDDITWSQTASPAWEDQADGLVESPFIPSAQPVFYPYSPPASGIRPLTPPSPVRRPSQAGIPWVPDLDTDSELDEMVDDIMQGVSGMAI
ncbi:hypothetical protein V2A60_006102 [Cordyceps javanica]